MHMLLSMVIEFAGLIRELDQLMYEVRSHFGSSVFRCRCIAVRGQISSMALELTTFRKFQFAGEKAWWEIKPADIVMINDVEYLKLPRAGINIGFTRLVVENCESVAYPLPRGFSLTQSRGYDALLQLRTTAHENDLLKEHNSKVPEMFRTSMRKAKQVRLTKELLVELKDHPDVVWITIPPCGSYIEPVIISVKRPLHPREELSVQCEGAVLQRIIEFIRCEGFDEALKRPKSLPRGIYRKVGGKYPLQYVHVDGSGKRTRHYAATMDEAILGVERGPIRDRVDGDHDDRAHDDSDDDAQVPYSHADDVVS